MLPTLVESFERPQRVTVDQYDDTKPLIDRYPQTPPATVQLLSQVGLTDAISWARTPPELSVGQQARLRVADALASPVDIVVLDDFCCGVDDRTAAAVAHTTGKALRANNRSAIVIAPDHHALEHLKADVHYYKGWVPTPTISHRTDDADDPPEIIDAEYRQGTMADWRKLAHLHYAAGTPNSIAGIYCVDDATTGDLCGVLVLVYPDLHNPARDTLTKDRYRPATDPKVARLLNREVRRIARLVIIPELRGCGLARQLIGYAISQTDHVWYEIATQMARYTPFLERIGFKEAPRPDRDVEAQLLDWYAQSGIESSALIDADELLREVDGLSVRKARLGRRLIWATYHRHVLHRRTKTPRPKQVPPASDPRWTDAAAFVTTRLQDRPLYFALGPVDRTDPNNDPC